MHETPHRWVIGCGKAGERHSIDEGVVYGNVGKELQHEAAVEGDVCIVAVVLAGSVGLVQLFIRSFVCE